MKKIWLIMFKNMVQQRNQIKKEKISQKMRHINIINQIILKPMINNIRKLKNKNKKKGLF